MTNVKTAAQILADEDMVVPDEFLIHAFKHVATTTQDDFVTEAWLGTPEGITAQAEYRAVEAMIAEEQEALMARNAEVELYESAMRHMRHNYGRPGTQLMLF